MLPPHSIQRLNDHFGDYVISVECRKCKHTRDMTPHALARIFGWEAEIRQISIRFRCSKCHAKNVDVKIGFRRRPRRWNKNPS
jgi:hypothetical protein